MNLIKFNQRFPDEESCRQYLKSWRERDGITCKRCSGKKHYWLDHLNKWECAECKSRTNLKAGTLFEKSKVKLLPWFQVIHLITATKKSLSANEIYRQINPDFPGEIEVHYSTVWYMVYKIRELMGKRDRRYKLQGEVELDHGFYEVVSLPKKDALGNIIKDKEKLKRGAGSQRQMKVMVMVESNPNPQQKNRHKKKRAMGFVKMVTMEDMSVNEVNYEVERAILPRTKVITDAHRGYGGIGRLDMQHDNDIRFEDIETRLPWVHTVIANSKRLLLGTHHSVGRTYLQGYLNEFCYKLNRRNIKTDLFDGLVNTSARDTWY